MGVLFSVLLFLAAFPAARLARQRFYEVQGALLLL
jgi:hypothetical protein